ncbi:hypothetical protein DFR52_10566 [Hoeflea marina]|uniref:Uncharacterized protein n=1 Tax=Hoeflea marina TaxID=274592 RepID=A0A317PEH3_9HYPH|nr:hypothetical protein [Hoeflea marina]PWV98088.1 hypothetical protein DFR52_10566 [Hoeflea marina]
MALAAFWMAGGHALFIPQATPAGAAVPVPASPTAMPTASVVDQPAAKPAVAVAEPVQVIRATPRPPRIERAGSILMIRGGS